MDLDTCLFSKMFYFVTILCFSLCLAGPYQQGKGKREVDERIVGGIDANIEDFPYQISLQYKGRHICGGSILSSKVILTAAHCTDRANASLMSIRAGSNIRNKGGVVIDVEEIIQHSSYNTKNIDYDISVLKLKEKLKYGKTIKAIETTDSEVGPNHFAVVTGWGTLKENGEVSDKLQQVYVPLLDHEECKSFYGAKKITDRMICAGFTEGGHDSCQGDSGGPLAYKDKLIGIVSWGIGCARPNYPGVYTSIPKIRSYLNLYLNE